MEFLVTANTNPAVYNNKTLQKATNAVYKYGEAIRKNWFAIAHVVAAVDASECYKDDGFDNVHEWMEDAFNLKKSARYSLLSIGKEYLREIKDASGKTIGYGTNLVEDGDPDFSKTQVEKMLPAGHDLAAQLVENGEITPEMTAKEIEKVVKSYKEDTTESETETETETETESTSEVATSYIVWDAEGNEYDIPVDVLEKYKVVKA